MALNPEPADPVQREEQHLPPKSYKDAAEEALSLSKSSISSLVGGDGSIYDTGAEEALGNDMAPRNDEVDEISIKESPGRGDLNRTPSEPRPLGEVIDEVEKRELPGSPSLRHPRGRLEENKGRGSFSDSPSSVREFKILRKGLPSGARTPSETLEGVGQDDTARSPVRSVTHKKSSSKASNDARRRSSTPKPLENLDVNEKEQGEEKDSEALQSSPKGNGSKENEQPENGANNKQAGSTADGANDETANLEGILEKPDETQDEVRTNSVGDRNAEKVGEKDVSQSEKSEDNAKDFNAKNEAEQTQTSNGKPAKAKKNGKKSKPTTPNGTSKSNTIYENTFNKSGENLATIKPSDSVALSMQSREDKPQDLPTESNQKKSSLTRSRTMSELVSGRQAGGGWAKSVIHWAPLNVPLQRRLQTMMVLLHTLSIVSLLSIFFLLCCIPILWPILVPYLLYCLLSRASTSGELSHRSEWQRRSKIWSLFAGYFPARLHRSQELEPTRKYVFGYHPHGIISHGAFVAFCTEALGFAQLFPGITNTLLTLDSNFRIPLYRDHALRMGLASVSRESCENILSKGGPNGEGMGRAITIVIGGAREALEAKPYSLKLVLKRRKGFVKLAIRTGADLVPVLAFGENDIYDQVTGEDHAYIHKAQLVMKKFMGFTVPLFHARGVFNYDVGIMPYRRPINIVVGRPILTLQSSTPDPAYVDEIHRQYSTELQRLWDEWKDTFAKNRRGEMEFVE